MHIKILGTESLGVRGLCCSVETKERKILIDPGIALGYSRHGLLPHPFQVVVGRMIRDKIISAFISATDVVISHYHGDHVPLVDANPYQLQTTQIQNVKDDFRFWAKGLSGLHKNMRGRARELSSFFRRDLEDVEGKSYGAISFSEAVAHGKADSHLGEVMMTKIEGQKRAFVHASDIQLLNREAIEQILEWQPDIVLSSGPPLYLHRLSKRMIDMAWENAVTLSKSVDTLILDHHIMRSEQGFIWLKRLSDKTGKQVICAADFMKRPRLLLEAWREQLYKDMPISKNWHENYAKGKMDFKDYRKWGMYKV